MTDITSSQRLKTKNQNDKLKCKYILDFLYLIFDIGVAIGFDDLLQG